MTDKRTQSDSPATQRSEPRNSNHVIWGMTLGVLIGTALGFIVFDNGGVGVAIGIVLGFVLSVGFYRAMK